MLLALILACHAPKDAPGDDTADTGEDVVVGPYEVDIRWTSWGIPHIQAADHGSLAFGMGYAFARDHACVLADQVVRARSERARYFGRGEGDANVAEDFGWLGLGVYRYAEEGWDTLDPTVQEAIVGYAAGYNRYIETEPLPPACAGADWVKPVSHIDLHAMYLALALNASGSIFVEAVGTATPPNATWQPAVPPLTKWTEGRYPKIGSNGWALGRDKAADGKALLLSNTHFPSQGELQWHESHLTIPGELDVYGASLMGVPVINLGFTRTVAWTHTVSFTPRFNAVLLTLDPSNPLRYEYDGGWRDITPEVYEISVLGDDGSVTTEQRTLYRSDWGPVLNAPGLGWSSIYAVALADVNEANYDLAKTWLGLDRAASLDDVESVLAASAGDPWVHIMAADVSGEVLYADPARTPNWSAAADARYPAWLDENPVAALFDGYGAVTIDGSDPTFAWQTDADAPSPGIVAYSRAPKTRRTDFVLNANDNYWLPNPASPLSGAPFLYGPVETPRSARTRMNLTLAGDAGEGTAAGADGRFTLDELEAAALSGRGKLAELLLPAVVDRCRETGTVRLATGAGAGSDVDLTAACEVLAAWDGTARIDSAGAVLWREMLHSGEFEWADSQDAGALFATPFDPADPVATPADLAAGDAPMQALGHAVHLLGEAGFPLDASYRTTQYQERNGVRYPVPGATYAEGVIQIASHESDPDATLLDYGANDPLINEASGLSTSGYRMNDGNSFVLAVELTESGPRARAIMTYSESEDPSSPHFADQTELYATQTLRPIVFEEADVAADTQESLHLSYP